MKLGVFGMWAAIACVTIFAPTLVSSTGLIWMMVAGIVVTVNR